MVNYPQEILPSDFFKRKINLDSLIDRDNREFFVCRRIPNPIETYLYDDGRPNMILNVEACLGKNLIGLSMNLMGSPFQERFLQYRCYGTAGKDWMGDSIDLENYIGETEDLNTGFPLYYSSKFIHRCRIPFQHTIKNKQELDSITGKIKALANSIIQKYPVEASVEYELFVRHRPVNLNYWHVQMEIKVASDNDYKAFDKGRGWLMKMYRHSIFGILEKNYVLNPTIPPLPMCISCYMSEKCSR